MTTLDDFNQPLSEMTDEELTELLREIRLNRRTPTKQTSTKKKQSKAKAPKIDTDTMSPEMAAKILEQLGEG